MRKVRHFTIAVALLSLATTVPFAGAANAQPQPPPPPGIGDLHVRIVHEAPPPRRHEVVIARPAGPNHTWIKGYWHHTGEAWAWNEGRWIDPPRPNAHWVVARYKHVQGGTQYVPGHWSHEHVIYN